MSELNNTVLKILENGKGILAADESTATMTKRLDSVNVPSTPENRLMFRETLFSSSSMKNCIGGVILYDETLRQTSSKKKYNSQIDFRYWLTARHQSRYRCKSSSWLSR